MSIITDTAMVELDPSSLELDGAHANARGTKALIDATPKWEYPGTSLPPRDMMERVAKEWEAYGLPKLDALEVPGKA